jgi:hypothetical protein
MSTAAQLRPATATAPTGSTQRADVLVVFGLKDAKFAVFRSTETPPSTLTHPEAGARRRLTVWSPATAAGTDRG